MFDPWAKFKADSALMAAKINAAHWRALEQDRNKWRSQARLAWAFGAVGWGFFWLVLLK